jgi:uncharacterized protein YndB with AHSA1/START domain
VIRFTNTIEIERPRNEVFAYLGDLEHTPEWNWAVDETTKTTEGPAGVGTEYRQTRSVPTRATETLRITAFEEPRLVAVEGTLGPFPARLSYELKDEGRHTTVINTVELDPPGMLRIASPILSRRIKASVADNLNVLKEQLEA